MMIRAHLENAEGRHLVSVSTGDLAQDLTVAPKSGGKGSSVNGGELLFLALATCYCNDVYREAARAGIEIHSVEVDVEGEFGDVGEPARDVSYRARVVARGAGEDEVRRLLAHTDEVAEIQNSLRAGVPVRLAPPVVELVE